MKNLPLGTQSFEKMRDTKSNFLYVDKTERIFDLVSSGSVFFLSRPRRFGKSLLASTLRALFEGRKEWFEGLYIYDKWDWSRKYPVINISFGSRSVGSAEILRNTLSSLMLGIAADNGIVLTEQYHTERFAQLIRELHREKKEKVVILIDEYDKAIRNNLNKSVEVQTAIREVLRDFYEVIKDLDEHIHFVFITGVTKFAGVSIFSGLNNLVDITLNPRFCDICGYTQKELQTYFDDYIDILAKNHSWTREKTLGVIKFWYNGYTWDGKTSIYNPYSTLNLFYKKSFSNYWFASATSGFLLDLVEKDYNYRELVFDEINVSENLL
ncbi:MAG: AAA family ATPase, partial [Elusimicrobiota bacterium]|nr:AAA family ATPase [Elusimicrobiota bacterium]